MQKSDNNITVTHINIRESISILVLKLLALDFIAAIFTMLFFAVTSFNPNASIAEKILSYNMLFFVLLGIFKILFTVYVVLLWLNEYYEMTPTSVLHKRGLLFREVQRFQLEDVRTIRLYQGLLGKLFNFGTIELQDIRRNKRVEMYLIHNPQRYVRILESLLGRTHEEKHEIRSHIFEKDEENEEDEEEKEER